MKGLRETIKNLGTEIDKSSWTPFFFNLTKEGDSEKLFKLINETSGISVHDEIENQLEELVKSLYPIKKLKGEALKEAVKEHIGKTPLDEYGNWVYYPWSKRLVHILEEEEYIFARTSRNMYKITPEEQEELRKKKIGVIGLSVGQSVSLTLAMERICGEIRLTDFDILELTNLNRIRTGVHTIGLKKVYAVAREIAEIDPYIRVRCFPEGLHEENMDSFFLENGKLDLLIEESDGFDIKVLSRFKAKELKIPVLMEASDRCMVDVERFDLEEDRPILHGLISHLDPAVLKTLKTNEEKIPYMLDILGIDSMSTRIKASMLEIDQTITTWPQLASAVIMGGGVTADVARRMLLGTFTDSGRYWVDVEELIGNKKIVEVKKEELEMPPLPKKLNIEFIQNDVQSLGLKKPDFVFSVDECEELIKIASTAPSAGNYQHWKWYYDNERIFLFHDRAISYNWSDSEYFAADLGIGTAIQTFMLGAEKLNIGVNYNYNTMYKNGNSLVAYFEKSINNQPNVILFQNKNLYQGIELRCTNRKQGRNEKIDSKTLNSIFEFTKINFKNHNFEIFEDQSTIDYIAEILGQSEKIRFLDPRGHNELFNKEIRWTQEEVISSKDGLDIATLELKASDIAGMKVASNPHVISLLKDWKKGSAFKKTSGDATKKSSAIGLISSNSISPESLIETGRLVQNLWIACNLSEISVHPISAPLFFTHRLESFNNYYTFEQENEFKKIRDRLYHLLDLNGNKKGIFMFRMHKSDSPSTQSLRKDINQILLKK